MARNLILSDLHLKTAIADKILNHVKYDKVIFSNDAFDSFGDTVEQNKNTAIWVKEKLEDSKYIFLMSNHAFSYMFPGNGWAFSSGYTEEKSKAIRSILNFEDFKKFKTYHIESNVLFTHAGLSRMIRH